MWPAVLCCGVLWTGDYYCDAMEELYSTFKAAGCEMLGTWPTEGYEHSESKVGEHWGGGGRAVDCAQRLSVLSLI